MLTLTSGFVSAVNSSNSLSPSAKNEITSKTQTGVQIVSESQAEQYVVKAGGSQATAKTVSTAYINNRK